ncbi:Helix-turn-helix domain protein [Xylophilus ampelinus]|uniref:HTH cro/C1-type domain-containing protein n=1 Tax=Variovorax paradoxus TaxID=34073 RepID=A0A2W5PMP0_VARPD|nr:MAG: hypothetical protein DI563_25535 [Variovorax paradoxus]VTY36671.1 Helix-turn-helix domain protein [Xylophilus ampelinus]
MPNIASILKAEITRVARKEVRSEIEGLKKANAQHRAAIAQLRRELTEVHRQMKRVQHATGSRMASAPVAEHPGDGTPRRFSAARLAAHRAKLKLSAADYGKLIGVSGATIYLWEKGQTRPPSAQVQALGELKHLSRKALQERLAGPAV